MYRKTIKIVNKEEKEFDEKYGSFELNLEPYLQTGEHNLTCDLIIKKIATKNYMADEMYIFLIKKNKIKIKFH